jgi:flagellar hook-associated protein 1 FlgK
MSITGAVANALSGLTASARSAEVISSNIANAMTDSYARREVVLANQVLGSTGAGVRVADIARVTDQTAIAERRLARASLGAAEVTAGFHARMEGTIGMPGEAGALTGRIDTLEGALAEAASRPEDSARLQAVVDAADRLAGSMNLISTEISTIRVTADREIADKVTEVNDTLSRIAGLNGEIRLHQGSGRDISALLDERQRLIDQVSQNIPIREIPRGNGEIALYSTAGAGLIEGSKAAEIGFTPANVITPQMSQAGGQLSGLTLDGIEIATSGTRQPLGGGALGALFEVRDTLAPQAQSQIDALARDLYERFADPAVDPTLAADEPGLFIDDGGAFDAAEELGLAGRIALSSLVDPAQGGALSRLRDGLGTGAVPGPVGDATRINALGSALAAPREPASGDFSGGTLSATGLAAEMLSLNGTARQTAEADETFASFMATTYDTRVLEIGVDTDVELQNLMVVETAYAANAQVLRTIDEMLKTVLAI